MPYDPRLDPPAPESLPMPRRRWVTPVLGIAMVWPLVVAVLFTAAGKDPDWGLVGTAGINAFPAVGLSPFARGAVFLPITPQGYDEFEKAALSLATARAHLALLALLLALCVAAAWAGANGISPMPTPRLWLLWAGVVLTLFTTLPAFIAEISIPFPTDEEAAA